jgi:cell wall-associated NlpC family hydrolase
MTDDWINDYVGVPYVPNGRNRSGWDCWGLVLAVYRDRLGVELPDWQWQAPWGHRQRLTAFVRALADVNGGAQVLRLAAPEPWAIALIQYATHPHHVGVVAGGGVLHAQPYGGTVYEPMARFLAGPNSNYGGAQWYRWRR